MAEYATETSNEENLFLGPTSTKVVLEFSKFAANCFSNVQAIQKLLTRENLLKQKHKFTEDLDIPEWNLHMTSSDMAADFHQVIRDLDDFAIKNRLDSRAAAIEELLMSKDCNHKIAERPTLKKCSVRLSPKLKKTKTKTRQSPRKVRKPQSSKNEPKAATKNGKDNLCWRQYGEIRLKSYECIKCGKVSLTKENYMNHLSLHGDEPSPPCHYCGNYFQSMLKYEKHIGNFSSEAIYACVKAQCSSRFVSWCRIACHERLHSGKPEFLCHICNAGFNTAQKCSTHVKQTHLSGFDLFKCSVCQKGFSTKSLLLNHTKTHRIPKLFKCQTCPRTFTSRPGLKYHWLMHMKVRPHKCKVCDKGFRNRADLKNHERIHSGERPFTCELCGKSFVEKAALRKHGVVHTGEKNFVCTQCGKQFGYKSSLTMHARKCGVEETLPQPDLDGKVDPAQDLLDCSFLPFTSKEPTTSQDFYDSVQLNGAMAQDVLNLLEGHQPASEKSIFSHMQF